MMPLKPLVIKDTMPKKRQDSQGMKGFLSGTSRKSPQTLLMA
jgi:hypothetical protein